MSPNLLTNRIEKVVATRPLHPHVPSLDSCILRPRHLPALPVLPLTPHTSSHCPHIHLLHVSEAASSLPPCCPCPGPGEGASLLPLKHLVLLLWIHSTNALQSPITLLTLFKEMHSMVGSQIRREGVVGLFQNPSSSAPLSAPTGAIILDPETTTVCGNDGDVSIISPGDLKGDICFMRGSQK